MDNEIQNNDDNDSVADAVAAVGLVVLFVAACVFWLSGQ